MNEIEDTGKVWLRGKVKPVYAVKLNGQIIIPDLEIGDDAICWPVESGLCVDLHHKAKQKRIARWFPNNIKGDAQGTLFSGFDKTKHADILAVLQDNSAVLEKCYEDDEYQEIAALDAQAFWLKTGLPWG